jgi:hypothetical protein
MPLPQSKYFFLMRRKAKKYFPIMWNRNTFFHKCFLKKINVQAEAFDTILYIYINSATI